jgi:hypothetical protein
LGPDAAELVPVLDDLSAVLLRVGRDAEAAEVAKRAEAIRARER